MNGDLIHELAAYLPGLPELRLHAADITECGWQHLGLLSGILGVLCIWGADEASRRGPVRPRHLGLLGSQLTEPLILAVGPRHCRAAAETGLEVMQALGHTAGGLITLQSLHYVACKPDSCKARQLKEYWTWDW